MAENTYRIGSDQRRRSFFAMLDSAIKWDSLFRDGFPVQYLPRVLFVAGLIIVYIGLTHNYENKIRKINRLERQVDDFRADYHTLKADYMFDSKQSEVARRAQGLGLEETVAPPLKIEIKEGEY